MSGPSPSCRGASRHALRASAVATLRPARDRRARARRPSARHRRRTEPEQRVRPGGQRARDLSRHCEHVAALLEREVGRDERAAPLARLDDDRRRAETGDDPVARREAPRRRLDARLVLGDDEARLADPARQLGVRRRVVAVDPAAEHGDRRAAAVERAAMRLAVDAPRHPAHDDETRSGQLARERARDRAAVRRSTRARRRSRRPADRAARTPPSPRR